MIKLIMGFDISSSCIGHCLLEWNDETNEIKFVECNNYKPPKEDGYGILTRLMITKRHIQDIIEKYSPDVIAIEDIVQFMKGKSSATTIITLAVFNRMIGILSYEYLENPPSLYNVMSIRHGLKLSKELPAKEDMLGLAEHHLNATLPRIYKKNGIDLEPETYDMADSVSVALYHAFILSGKIIRKQKKPKAKKSKKESQKEK